MIFIMTVMVLVIYIIIANSVAQDYWVLHPQDKSMNGFWVGVLWLPILVASLILAFADWVVAGADKRRKEVLTKKKK